MVIIQFYTHTHAQTQVQRLVSSKNRVNTFPANVVDIEIQKPLFRHSCVYIESSRPPKYASGNVDWIYMHYLATSQLHAKTRTVCMIAQLAQANNESHLFTRLFVHRISLPEEELFIFIRQNRMTDPAVKF